MKMSKLTPSKKNTLQAYMFNPRLVDLSPLNSFDPSFDIRVYTASHLNPMLRYLPDSSNDLKY